jgi:acyl-CoA thioester hydrolase
VKHRTQIRVIYGDTDRMGYAYNGNYFRWFEIGRTEMFRSLGLPYREIEARGVFLPLSECGAKFTAPARYDDLLTVETAVDGSVRGGIKFDYRIYREADGRLLAEGFTKHACVDADGRVMRPPAFIREVIAKISADRRPASGGEAE